MVVAAAVAAASSYVFFEYEQYGASVGWLRDQWGGWRLRERDLGDCHRLPPGSTTNCQTVDNVLVDTGSAGLRILKSALPTVSGLAGNDNEQR